MSAQPASPARPAPAPAAERLTAAWTELRRGASATAMRSRVYGSGPDALEPGQFDTLARLAERDSWRMGELAAALRVDASTVTRAVIPLEERGLAARTRDADDGRCVRVALTPDGRTSYEHLKARLEAVWSAMLDTFDAAELDRFAGYMERLAGSLDRLLLDAALEA